MPPGSLSNALVEVNRRLDTPGPAPSIAGSRRSAHHHHRGGSPTPSTASVSSASTYMPDNERLDEILEYVTAVVRKDKENDDKTCGTLIMQRQKFENEFSAARQKYEKRLLTNNSEMKQINRAQSLKRDTIRLLRAQYKSNLRRSGSRFATKVGVEPRMGSERGRSRTPINRAGNQRAASVAASRAASPAGSRMATPIPVGGVKLETIIDLTGGRAVERERTEIVEVAETEAGEGRRSRMPSVAPSRVSSRAASISRNLGGNLYSRAGTPSRSIKVHDVNDLMRPSQQVITKRSPSVGRGSRSHSRASSIQPVQDYVNGQTGAAKKAVEEWMKFSRSPALQASRAGTSAPTAHQRSNDSEMMPPPPAARTPLALAPMLATLATLESRLLSTLLKRMMSLSLLALTAGANVSSLMLARNDRPPLSATF